MQAHTTTLTPRMRDLTGQQFHNWTVVQFVEKRGKLTRWLCRCVCGREHVIDRGSLWYGRSRSCGCQAGLGHHGMAGTAVYSVYDAMKQRCRNPKNAHYASYGGRGITVCDRWLGVDGFTNFLADMGPRAHGATLERKDNNGSYCPENCCWADRKTQSRNTRTTVFLTLGELRLPLAAWAERLGIPRKTLSRRHAAGWTDERVLTTPYRPCTMY